MIIFRRPLSRICFLIGVASVSVAVAVGISLITKHPSRSSADNFAKIELPDSERNLGVITPGMKVRSEFVIRNTGRSPLILSNVKTSCGCTAADITPKEVPAGSEGRLEVLFDVPERMDPIHHTVSFDTNDPQHETVSVSVMAKPVWPVAASPPTLHLSIVENGETITRKLDIYSPRDLAFKVTNIQTSSSSIRLEEVDSGVSRHTFNVRIGLEAVGRLNEVVELSTDLDGGHILRIPVTGEVIARSGISPNRLLLGRQPNGEVVEREINIQGASSISFTDAYLKSEQWTVEHWSSDGITPSGTHKVRIQIRVPESAGFHETFLHMQTISPGDSFDLPVSCYVKKIEMTSFH
ncbi:MAG: DUF1573 domain-containing protein [Planctomycetaceae bacterium]|nr:DUF1573 domain-containing protein [Planctomycetaceae bacterium]